MGTRISGGLTPTHEIDWEPVSLGRMEIDHLYQRGAPDDPEVARITRAYSEAFIGTIEVSERIPPGGSKADAVYKVIDGQRRVAAMKALFHARTSKGAMYPPVTAKVHRNIGIKEEAAIFVLMNGNRVQLRWPDFYRGFLAAEDPATVEVQAILQRHSLTVGDKTSLHVTNAVSALYIVQAWGRYLDATLAIIDTAWGDKDVEGKGHTSPAILGIGMLLAGAEKLDRDRLIKVLSEVSPGYLLSEMRVFKEKQARVGQGGKPQHFYYASVVAKMYNRGLTGKGRLVVENKPVPVMEWLGILSRKIDPNRHDNAEKRSGRRTVA